MSETISLNRPTNLEEWKLLEKSWNESPAFIQLGAMVDLSDEKQMKIRIEQVDGFHRGDFNYDGMTAGIISWLCDFAIGLFSSIHLPDGYKGTADLHIDFIEPLRGDVCEVISEIERCSSGMCRAIANVYDGNYNHCAFAKGRVMHIKDINLVK